jgi:outer membrane protein assembly factor BamB
MVSNDVTRRGVMRGVGVVTSARLASGVSGARRDNQNKLAETSTRPVVDNVVQKSWPQSGGTAARTGRRRGALGPKSTVAYRWRVDRAVSGIAVANGIVYASDETTLRALSAEDGTEVWTERTSDERRHRTTSRSPAVDGTLVYTGETRKRSRVLALDTTTGEKAWEFEPERTAAGYYSPTVADGVVYVIGRNFGAGSVGLLYALDGATGNPLWKRETGTSGIAGYEAPPVAVENGVVYLAADELFALDAQTGETFWSSDSNGRGYKADGKNTPAVANGRVYVGHGTQTTFEARHIADGSHAWTHTPSPDRNETTGTKAKSETGVWTGSAVDDDTVYVGLNSRMNGSKTAIYAFAADDGTVRWRTRFGDDRFPVHTPAIADGVVYTGGAALSSDDGSVLWRLDAPTNAPNQIAGSYLRFSPPAIADETLYIGGQTLRAITGRT